MPHSSGGGSHGGGPHGGSGGSRSYVPRVSDSYREGYHRYVIYEGLRPKYFYSDKEIQKGDSRFTVLDVFRWLLYPALFCFLWFPNIFHTPEKLPLSYEQTRIIIQDNADQILKEDEEALKATFLDFQEETGITPALITFTNDLWQGNYESFEAFAYDTYVKHFSDESHWLICYSTDPEKDSFDDWYWEGMQGDDTDGIITKKIADTFTKNVHKYLLARDRYTVGEAFNRGFQDILPVVMKKGLNLNNSEFRVIAILLAFSGLGMMVTLNNKQKLKGKENAVCCPMDTKEIACAYCGGIYVYGIHQKCPYCGAPLTREYYDREFPGEQEKQNILPEAYKDNNITPDEDMNVVLPEQTCIKEISVDLPDEQTEHFASGKEEAKAPLSEKAAKKKNKEKNKRKAGIRYILIGLAVLLYGLLWLQIYRKTNVPTTEKSATTAVAEAWVDVPVTVENITSFYEVDLKERRFETASGGRSISPQLTLTYKLKPEFKNKIDLTKSSVEIKVRGDYVLRRIESINWLRGEINFTEEPSAEMVVNLQHIALANGNASVADNFSRLLIETATGVLEIPIPLNRLAAGVFIINSGVKGPISPLLKSDYVKRGTWGNTGTWLAQLENLRIVSACGTLRLKGYSGSLESDASYSAKSNTSMAEADEAENLEYLPLKDGKVKITRYARSGEMMIVPQTMEGYTISEIGDYAFAYRDTLKEIILADGLTTIGDRAFEECYNLEKIVLPDTVASIGEYAFDGCTGVVAIVHRDSYAEQYCKTHDILYRYADGTVSEEETLNEKDFEYRLLEDGTAEITWYSGRIKRLSVPDQIAGYTVTSIGKAAFKQSDIISVTLPDSINNIGDSAFELSIRLISITLPDGLQSIGRSAFNNCYKLMSIVIPDGITRINDYTFYCCKNLSDVTIPDSVAAIGNHAFSSCGIRCITIPGSVTSIGGKTFSYDDELRFVVEIGSYAEQYCKKHDLQYQYAEGTTS